MYKLKLVYMTTYEAHFFLIQTKKEKWEEWEMQMIIYSVLRLGVVLKN